LPPLPEPARIRPAEPRDVPLLLELIRDLAEYERAVEAARGTEDLLHRALFGENAVAEAVIAEVNGVPAGFAIYYRTFSTWQCLPGLWLEDLFVVPAHRRGGIGRALLSHLAQLAVTRGYGRVEWSALKWNTPAIDFYGSLEAFALDEWQVFRLTGSPLRALAGEAG
jgi:GNAT superfamily N-acetyltransferase